MNITAIVPVHNEEKLIGNCLNSIMQFDSVNQILVIDDDSSDNTVDIARQYEKVKCITGKFKTDGVWDKVKQLNTGLEDVEDDFIMPLSADMILTGFDKQFIPADDKLSHIRVLSCLRMEFWLDAYHVRINDGVFQTIPLIYRKEGLLYTGEDGWHYPEGEFILEDESLVLPDITMYHLGWIRSFPEQIIKHIRNLKCGAWGEFGNSILQLKERGIEAWAISHVIRYKNTDGLLVSVCLNDEIMAMRYDYGFKEFQDEYYKKYDEDLYSAVIRLVPPDLIR